MAIPHDHRAPASQQRWIELQNVSNEPIPPFAVLEVVDSYRPEQTIPTETPQGGRTVLKVQKPTKEVCRWVVNGPMIIEPTGFGRPGTMDDPMLALVAEEYPPNTAVGAKPGSFKLWQGYCGFWVLGDYDLNTGGTMRVAELDNCNSLQTCWMRADYCIPLGSTDSTATPQKWSEDEGQYIPGGDPVSIDNRTCTMFALKGELFQAISAGSCGAMSNWIPVGEYGLDRMAQALEGIDMYSSGRVMFLKPKCEETQVGEEVRDCDISPPEPQEYCEATACNGFLQRTIYSGEVVHVRAFPGCCWMIVGAVRATTARAKAAGPMCQEDGTIGLTDVEFMDYPASTVPKPSQGMNWYQLACLSHDELFLTWHNKTDPEAEEEWIIVQVKHHKLEKVVTNVALECPSLNFERATNVPVMSCDEAAPGKETWATLSSYDVLTGLTGSCTTPGQGIYAQTRSFWFLCSPGSVSQSAVVTLTAKDFVTGVTMSTDCSLKYQYETVYGLFCDGGSGEQTVGTAETVTAITEITIDCDGLHTKTRVFKAFCVESETEITPIASEEITVITGVSKVYDSVGGTCKVLATTATLKYLGCEASTAADVELFAGTSVTVLTDAYLSGTDVDGDFQTVYAMCAGSETSDTLWAGTNCPVA